MVYLSKSNYLKEMAVSKYNGACTYLILSPKGTPYVGQAQKFHRRMWGHKSKGKLAWINHAKWKAGKHKHKVCAICFAIHKYGWENMRVIILEKYSEWTQQLLDDREQYFIRFYDSLKNGYNCNEGGNRAGVIKHTAEAKAKISAKQMGNTNSLTKPVTSCLIKEEYADGTQLVEFVSYASAAEAEAKTGVSNADISNCCLKKKNSAGGRFWHFTKEDELEGLHRVPRIGDKPTVGKSTHKRALFSESPGGVTQLHESAAAAGRDLSELTGKKFSQGHISSCCNPKSKRTRHFKYTFYFATPEMIAEFKKEAVKKRKRE